MHVQRVTEEEGRSFAAKHNICFFEVIDWRSLVGDPHPSLCLSLSTRDVAHALCLRNCTDLLHATFSACVCGTGSVGIMPPWLTRLIARMPA